MKYRHLARLALFVVLGLLGACGGKGGGNGGATGPSPEPTFTVDLPAAVRDANHDSITVPDGRPIYAILVSGYAVNGDFSELYYYSLAHHLAANNAYVHFAWWNNLLAPYLERPLHNQESNPGALPAAGVIGALFQTPAFNPYSSGYGDKAVPNEDDQFQADAKRFLRAIREHNPDARIIIVGHSMGGGAVARLGADPEIADIDIDILAPIDPVGNRNHPISIPGTDEYNWTRWRATHQPFLGYRQRDCVRGGGWFGNLCRYSTQRCLEPTTPGTIPGTCCRTVGGWRNAPLVDGYVPTRAPLVCPGAYVHSPDTLRFGPNIRYLYHRWQTEATFPFDYTRSFRFAHPGATVVTDPVNGTNDQRAVETCASGQDPTVLSIECHAFDGHGEIVGYRNFANFLTDLFHPIPYGTRASGDWPTYLLTDSIGERGEKGLRRREKLRNLGNWLPFGIGNTATSHAPEFPMLDIGTAELIRIVDERFNLPPP